MANRSNGRQTNCTPARLQAEQAAAERLLNAYLRETGVFDPRFFLTSEYSEVPAADLLRRVWASGTAFRVELPNTGCRLLGSLTYFSVMGHHRFGEQFWLSRSGGTFEPLSDYMGLIKVILEELASTGNLSGREPDETLLRQIENSIGKTTLYLERRHADPSLRSFVQAEQSLCFGHPFHPTPKSSEGFSTEDLARYAPELGASFPLHYFAAPRELVREAFLPGIVGATPAQVRAEALERLTPPRYDWRLLPCHPWQAELLNALPSIQRMLAAGELQYLGALGDPVFPTSSVRTVWAPAHRYSFKLPLSVRITHFIRVNSSEQVERSMAVSQAVASIRERLSNSSFQILTEVGYRTLCNPAWSEEEQESIGAQSTVLFRETPQMSAGTEPRVLAGLLETGPDGTPPPLIAELREAAGTPHLGPEFLERWLRAYLEISLLPLLRCFLRGGISLEAHVQNSLVVLEEGWPSCFLVRDLEGASISRERREHLDLYKGWLPDNSAALYSDEEAWHRFKYYFVVNHLGHLLSVLAYYGGADEAGLWRAVRRFLDEQAKALGQEGGAAYVEDLCHSSTLPAKANLYSHLQGRGETPLYVPIPNPLRDQLQL